MTAELDPRNADLLRIITAFIIWGPNGSLAINSLKGRFSIVRRIIAHCSKQGIFAGDLMCYPRVFDELANKISGNNIPATTLLLHRLWEARLIIGCSIFDIPGLKKLAELSEPKDNVQTAYIPARIWKYQIDRLRECIEDFRRHQQQLERCFEYCVDAYISTYGSLEKATSNRSKSKHVIAPFAARAKKLKQHPYFGPFALTADRFGIKELLERWIGERDRGMEVRHLSAYMTLVQTAGLAYIANFTIQRINEAASLRADCLLWDTDPQLGRIPLICGPTTKTERDSDARWPTSPSVESAILAMTAIAKLRVRCAEANSLSNPTEEDMENPYLFNRAFEPWSSNSIQAYGLRPHVSSYKTFIRQHPQLMDAEMLRITEEDIRIAKMLTPNLGSNSDFAIGNQWPLAWHQLRRTGAVNMFASGLLSDSSIQFVMKHRSHLMPLYYGRGHTKLKFNAEVGDTLIGSMHEVIARNLQSAMGSRFISPLGEERKNLIVNLINKKDLKMLAAASKKNNLTFREIRLGACAKRTTCSYGGIESVARCAGGDGAAPCADALFDREKTPEVEATLREFKLKLKGAPLHSPRWRALTAEVQAMENFLNVTRSK